MGRRPFAAPPVLRHPLSRVTAVRLPLATIPPEVAHDHRVGQDKIGDVTSSTEFGTTSNLPVDIEIPGYRLRRQIGSDPLGLWFDAEQESLNRGATH